MTDEKAKTPILIAARERGRINIIQIIDLELHVFIYDCYCYVVIWVKCNLWKSIKKIIILFNSDFFVKFKLQKKMYILFSLQLQVMTFEKNKQIISDLYCNLKYVINQIDILIHYDKCVTYYIVLLTVTWLWRNQPSKNRSSFIMLVQYAFMEKILWKIMKFHWKNYNIICSWRNI